jgi:MFS transporter, ACS family, hexuronate transporter
VTFFSETNRAPSLKPPISNLRWWIGGLLFFSTVINYIDRQTLSALAPYLKNQYHWTNEDYALILVSFRVAYAIGQTGLGRFIDRVGTRLGLTVTVIGYSLVAMLTSFASGFRSFAFFRFFLGLGESPNWPGAAKAVSEWFPGKERAWAVALYDSGSSLGAAITPAIAITVYTTFGDWRPAFIFTGTLGFIWVFLWRCLYHSPESHPRISEKELNLILEDRKSQELAGSDIQEKPGLLELLKIPQTWGILVARACTDPVYYFIADWFMIYLVSKGFKPETTLLAFWIPFVAVDLGNFAGGGVSSWLVKRGWPIGKARKAVVIFGAIGMTLLIPTIFMSNLFAIAGTFALSTFAYATFCTMALVMPADLFRSPVVASVSGLSGTAAGILTIFSTFLIGWVADRYSFAPILIAASIIPLFGAVLVLILTRNTEKSGTGVLLKI